MMRAGGSNNHGRAVARYACATESLGRAVGDVLDALAIAAIFCLFGAPVGVLVWIAYCLFVS